MFIFTVDDCQRNWRRLKDNFTRMAKRHPTQDFSRHELSFVLQNHNINKSDLLQPSLSQEKMSSPTAEAEVKSSPKCGCEEDGLDIFFRGISSSMRKLHPLKIAQLKLDIATLVGQAEVEAEYGIIVVSADLQHAIEQK